ncbi:MAG: DUF58 domain-containing protein [Deltaproteobacteria bacterium]|nr:DUF58 domain-containing protein [Deltaproteobacteria bacterium]
MLSPELIQQIRNIEIKAGHLVTEAIAGEYVSVFKGVGMEFEKVREYAPGDDIRSIDWNVTARMGTPYVKVFREERELTLMLLVDVSPSQAFGTTGKMKNEASAELAAILAFLATKNNDKVGLILFSDHVELYIPPKKGRAHVWRIIREVLTHKGKGKATNIREALDYLSKVCKRKTMSFLVSDFCADAYEKALNVVSRRHDLVCVKIEDQREKQLAPCGFLELLDAETGEHLVIDSNDLRLRKQFETLARREDESFAEMLRKKQIDLFKINTSESVVAPLVAYMHLRERRKRR